MNPIYLDNNATTRLASEVLEAMLPYLCDLYGNPSSAHRLGQESRHGIDEARARVAGLINCSPAELIFTSGGTESINAAIRGLYRARPLRPRVITSTVEHSATRGVCQMLKAEGCEIVEIPVDHAGQLDLDRLRGEVDDRSALVSIMWVNNETGVILQVPQIAEICRAARVPFHCDATQAIGKIAVNVRAAGVDAASFAAHKFHGPKGVGGLYVRRGTRLATMIVGGPQELTRRGGTENLPGIIGMGKAAELAQAHLADMPRVAALRDHLESEILRTISDTAVNGSTHPAIPNSGADSGYNSSRLPNSGANSSRLPDSGADFSRLPDSGADFSRLSPSSSTDLRVPNTTNIGFARLEAEAILLLLSERGIYASAGAACSSGSLEASHVLQAMKIDPHLAHGAIRFSLSRYTTDDEIQQTLATLPGTIERLRKTLPPTL